jgi:DsbC/DsbD-like thiol-disulfide interchange protein
VALTPVDPSKPIVLAVAAEFGLCRDICIPVQPSLRVTVPPAASGDGAVDGHLAEALGRVPRPAATAAAAPRIERVTARLSGDKPQVVIEARFPGEAGHGDVFLEAPDGLWIPLPQPAGAARDGVRRFVVDLTDGADVSDLKGRSIRATLVGSQSQSEATFDLVELN